MALLRVTLRHVLFASWQVAPQVVASRLPKGLVVDTHDHAAWVSLVAFENHDLGMRRLPAGTGVDLPQLNLRTYVTHEGDPGIFLFSIDMPGFLASWGARFALGLPVFRARTTLRPEGEGLRFVSERRQPGAPAAVCSVLYRPEGEAQETRRASLERFLLERYRLFMRTPLGLARLDVAHAPWRPAAAVAAFGVDTVPEASGLPAPSHPPLCHYVREQPMLASFPRRA